MRYAFGFWYGEEFLTEALASNAEAGRRQALESHARCPLHFPPYLYAMKLRVARVVNYGPAFGGQEPAAPKCAPSAG